MSKTTGVQCFKYLEIGHYSSKCPHKRNMVLKEDTRSPYNFPSLTSEEVILDFEEESLPYEGELLLL